MTSRITVRRLMVAAATLALGGALAATPAQAAVAPAAAASASVRTAVSPIEPMLVALSPNKSAVYEWKSGSGWTQIGGPAGSVVTGGGYVIATNPTTGNVYRYNGTPMSWSQIGGPGAQFAIDSFGDVVALSPDRSAVMELPLGETGWIKIGGPAAFIAAGGSSVIATNPTTGNVYRYNGTPMSWSQIGGPAAGGADTQPGFGLDDFGNVYGLSPDKQAVMELPVSATSWIKIGGPASSIIASGGGLLATSPATDPTTANIYQYDGRPMSWSQIGGPGHQFTQDNQGDVFALSPDQSAVMELPATGTGWTKIGGPASFIAAS
ncbi:hypothetical protein [Kitasatospora sp. LaBMicrA B282]|uniref:hypothetical protein n=1 Tax=Kitasatospora sp. LaBMicrA B282 TaxID=3420949 RepID=UPI003D146EC7